MGHSINVWIQLLVVPVFAVAGVALLHFGFSGLKTLLILLPIFCVLMLICVILDPGPTAKRFVESLKNRPD